MGWLGIPNSRKSSTPNSWKCSGYVNQIYRVCVRPGRRVLTMVLVPGRAAAAVGAGALQEHAQVGFRDSRDASPAADRHAGAAPGHQVVRGAHGQRRSGHARALDTWALTMETGGPERLGGVAVAGHGHDADGPVRRHRRVPADALPEGSSSPGDSAYGACPLITDV